MEGLTRLVSESLARHGFDRPLDYRRLHWSRWFRCDSHHSLLFVPSKPGVFAVAEEVMDFGRMNDHVATAAKPALSAVEGAVPQSEASGPVWDRVSDPVRSSAARPDLAGSTASPRRMLAVTQFFEDDDMAFVLDRMLSRQNPMGARLASGRYFVRFVVIEDQTQRRSICSALNQWMVSAAEKATGIGSHFATSLELTPATEYIPHQDDRQQSLFPEKENKKDDAGSNRERHDFSRADRAAQMTPALAAEGIADSADTHVATAASAVPLSEASGSDAKPGFRASHSSPTAPHLNSGAATNIHCPSPFPSGF